MEESTLPRDEAVEQVEIADAAESEAPEPIVEEPPAAAVAEEVPAAPEEAPIPELESAPEPQPEPAPEMSDENLKAVLEGVVYVADEPLSAQQIAAALDLPQPRVEAMLAQLVEEYARPERGLSIKEVAGGYKMSTKAEHHEAIRRFVKNLKAPFKLSLAALETLAVIAYKQPITAPEIMEIRGVQGAGVLKTLLDRKLITTAGRKAVVGKPILYKTTKDFLVQFGLKDLSELPTLKEFEELRRLALTDAEPFAVGSEEVPVTSEALPQAASPEIGEGVVAVEDAAPPAEEPKLEEVQPEETKPEETKQE